MQMAVRLHQARPRVSRRRWILQQVRMIGRLGGEILALTSLAGSLGLGLLLMAGLVH